MFMNKVREGERDMFQPWTEWFWIGSTLWAILAVAMIEYNPEMERNLGLLATSSSHPDLAPNTKHVFPFNTG